MTRLTSGIPLRRVRAKVGRWSSFLRRGWIARLRGRWRVARCLHSHSRHGRA